MNRNVRKVICSLTAVALLHLPVCAEIVKVPAGTAIMLKTTSEVTSSSSVGDIVSMVVVQDLVVNGKTVAKAGAGAIGEVTALAKNGFFGVPSEITVTVKRVTMIDSNMISVNTSKTVKGNDRMACSVIGAILCLFPALIRGGDAKIAAGAMFDAIMTAPGEVTIP
jgi:hypothetical protein